MDENFQNYNNQWLQYNNFHQDPINGLLEIPFSEQISNPIPESDQFFMDPAYVGVSRFHNNDHGEIIPTEGSNSSHLKAFMEDSSRKERSGKPVKRRSRASRRTPPTLLNASVKNFRDLVQQYTGCESSSGKNQKGPVNLSFGSSIDHQMNGFVENPGFYGGYDDQNCYEQQSFHEYDHVKQGFL